MNRIKILLFEKEDKKAIRWKININWIGSSHKGLCDLLIYIYLAIKVYRSSHNYGSE